jgi:dTDP-glucose 4,6-dehydratase
MILVTGGAGFIGGAFVRNWLDERAGLIVVLDKLTYAASLSALSAHFGNPHFVFCEGDIADERMVGELLERYRIRQIVNLAAETHVDRSIDAPAPFVATNVVGTWHLLEAAIRHQRKLPSDEQHRFRFLHVSTDEVFGPQLGDQKACEMTQYAPSSPYAAAKSAADHFVSAYHRTYGLPTLITYATNNYGPYQHPEKLIPLMITNALAGRRLPIYGDGLHVRDWMFVDDHVRALRAVLEKGTPGMSYAVSADCPQSNLQLTNTLCAIIDRLCPSLSHRPCRSLIEHVADRPGHDRRYALDSRKLRSEFGWKPKVSLDEGLEQTVAWFVKNQ